MILLYIQTCVIVLKEAKKKWEDELRAQMAENEREIKKIRTSRQEELRQVELKTPGLVGYRRILLNAFSQN